MVTPLSRETDLVLVNGSTRIPLHLVRDQGGRLAYQIDDETAVDKVRLLWEQGRFDGGMGQMYARDPSRYLMAYGMDTAREEGFRLAPAVTWTSQFAASPYTVQTATPEIRGNECRPTTDAVTLVTVDAAAQNVWVGARVRVEAGSGHGLTMRYQNTTNHWRVILNQASSGGANALQLTKYVAGAPTVVGNFNMTVTAGTTYLLTVNVDSSSNWTVYVDGVSRITATDTFNSTYGIHGLVFESQAGTKPGISDWWVEGYIYDGFANADATALTSHVPTFNQEGTGFADLSYTATGLYFCDGLNVYRWDGTNWDHRIASTRPAETLQTIFDMKVYGGNLYVARGSSAYIYTSDGNTWTISTFSLGWWPYAFTILRDTFFGVSADSILRSSTNPVNGGTWSSAIATLGDSRYDTNDLETWADLTVIGKDDGVWTTDITGLIYHMTPEMRKRAADANARSLLAWQGRLFVPTKDLGLGVLSLAEEPAEIGFRTTVPALSRGQAPAPLGSLQTSRSSLRITADERWLYASLPGYVVRGSWQDRRWRWHGFLASFDPFTGANQPSGWATPFVDGANSRLWFQEGSSATAVSSVTAARVGYISPENEDAFPIVASYQNAYSLVTSAWDGGPEQRNRTKSFDYIVGFCRNATATAPIRVNYTTNQYNGVPVSGWTQMQSSSGSATTITAAGLFTLYFPANTTGQNVMLQFLLRNDQGSSSPEIIWYMLYGRMHFDQRRVWTVVANLSRGTRPAGQRGPLGDPKALWTNLRTARNQANPVTLRDLDDSTIRVNVVALRELSDKESTRYQQSGQDKLLQVVLSEAVAN